MKNNDEQAPRFFRFGEYELDEGRLELRHRGMPISLQAKPLRLLLLLLEHRDRYVSKPELFDWWDAVVSDAAISSAIKDIRHALGDDPGSPRWIETRRTVGYRFVGDVEVDGSSPPEGLDSGGFHGVPSGISMCFLGREPELRRLADALTHEAGLSTHVAIEGMAGMGKTQLALQLVHQLARENRFPGGIYWLDAENPDLQSAWGATLADSCGMAPGLPAQRSAALLRKIAGARSPVLLVLDNVESWTSASKPRPLPEGPHVRLLVTTRERNLAGSQFLHVELGVLRDPFDRELLLRVAGRDVEPGVGDLRDHLAGYPLGLEIAGAYLAAYPAETARSYLQNLRSHGAEVEQIGSQRIPYEQTVSGAFRALWDRLDARARTAWRIASCFEPVPTTRALAAATGIDPVALDALEKRHIVQSPSAGRWMMHRLTKVFGETGATEQERSDARRAFVQGCLEHLRRADRVQTLRTYMLDRAQFDRALDLAATAPQIDVATLFTLRDTLERAFYQWPPRHVKRLIEASLDEDLGRSRENRTIPSAYQSLLSRALSNLGDLPRALRSAEKAIEDAIQRLGAHHPFVAEACQDLAGGFIHAGDPALAAGWSQRALDILKRDPRTDPGRIVGQTMKLAAVVYKLGEAERARDLLLDVLETFADHEHADPRLLARLRSGLAWVLSELGEQEEGKLLCVQALRDVTTSLGLSDLHTTTYSSNLARYLRSIGEPDAARQYERQTFAIFCSAAPAENPVRVDAQIHLADEIRPGPGGTAASGWFLAGSVPDDFEAGTTPLDGRSDELCGFVQSRSTYHNGSGVLMQQMNGTPWRGQRIQMSARCKTENVKGSSSLWMAVDGESRPQLSYGDLRDQASSGTTDWAQGEVVLDVPADALRIRFGVIQEGAGRTLVSRFFFRVVGDDVPVSDLKLRAPSNLRFEDSSVLSAAALPRGWIRSGGARESFEAGTSRSDRASGGRCGFLRARDTYEEGFGSLAQTIGASIWRGLRIRMSGWCRTEAVQGWAALWVRVDGHWSEPLCFDVMQDRALKGTTEWTQHELVFDVPEGSEVISFGVLQIGMGQSWIADLEFAPVDTDYPLTGRRELTGEGMALQDLLDLAG